MRWVVRLVETGDDAVSRSADLMDICRPEGLGENRGPGLEPSRGEATSDERSESDRCESSRSTWAASSGLPFLQREMPREGLAAAPDRDAVRRSDGATSPIFVCRLQSHRDGYGLAVALPVDA